MSENTGNRSASTNFDYDSAESDSIFDKSADDDKFFETLNQSSSAESDDERSDESADDESIREPFVDEEEDVTRDEPFNSYFFEDYLLNTPMPMVDSFRGVDLSNVSNRDDGDAGADKVEISETDFEAIQAAANFVRVRLTFLTMAEIDRIREGSFYLFVTSSIFPWRTTFFFGFAPARPAPGKTPL